MEWLAVIMFGCAALVLLSGYPVAFALGGTAVVFAVFGVAIGAIPETLLNAMPTRLYGIMGNVTLMAVPLFIFMGVTLEKAKIAEDLLTQMAKLWGRRPGGLALSVAIVGMLLAASTGIVGATVVTMGLLSLPAMLRAGYHPKDATGIICAAGTLGQIIPPSIVLVLLGDVLSSAYQQAQRAMGKYPPDSVSVGDLFAGALIPGITLVALYCFYLFYIAWRQPKRLPAAQKANDSEHRSTTQVWLSFIAPLLLIVLVLGAILGGVATPTEASALGAAGALMLATIKRQLTWQKLLNITSETALTTGMVFMILIGASIFSLVFRAFGGDDLIHQALSSLPGGHWTALVVVLITMFLLGFILDFIEITFVVVPLVAPALLVGGFDPVWLGVIFAIVLQTSFLTPPFGFSLFYLRGVAPTTVKTADIYRGVLPYILIQLALIGVLVAFPQLATSLPQWLYGH